jgi:hypothetical protein
VTLMLITKSRYIAGIQCLKRLYLIVHNPELAMQPDESVQSIIEQGQQIGLLARQMFVGGVTVESRDRDESLGSTRELIENPEIPAIYAWRDPRRLQSVRVSQRTKRVSVSAGDIGYLKEVSGAPRDCRREAHLATKIPSGEGTEGRIGSGRTSVALQGAEVALKAAVVRDVVIAICESCV